jgi:predicted O-methyltransferase YrrM
VDEYIAANLIGPDAELDAALTASQQAGLPPIAVSAPQGKLLHLIATGIGAKRILEIGTLGGYSTIWLARALPPEGRLVTLEIDERHASVARANLERAGLADRVDIRIGPALATLDQLEQRQQEPFDLAFIDADKENIPAYFDRTVKLSRPGAVIITDNVVRDGALADPATTDPRVRGVQAFHEMLAARSDVAATTIQTVGAKGYDGFNLAVVKG